MSRLSWARCYSLDLDASHDCLACHSMTQVFTTRLTSPRNCQRAQTVQSHIPNGPWCLNLHDWRLDFKNQDSLTLHSSGVTKIIRESIRIQVNLKMYALIFWLTYLHKIYAKWPFKCLTNQEYSIFSPDWVFNAHAAPLNHQIAFECKSGNVRVFWVL